MTIRVAQVMGKMNGYGVESVVMNYYRHIDRDRVQFDLIVDSDSSRVPADEVESLGGRVYEVPPYQRQPANSAALERLFRREGWAIVHSHMNALSAFPLRAAKRAGVPVRIAHSHSTWGRGEWGRNALKAALRTQANRYPTHRMACSRHAGEWLFGRGADFVVLPNAIEPGRFAYDPEARARLRAELGVPADALVVGHVGRFVPQKNHAFLVRAFAELWCRRPGSYLLLVGDGPLVGDVRRLVGDLGLTEWVVFAGQRDDVAKLYSAMDVFCMPSLYEGFGIAALEAQVAGLPCVLSCEVPQDVSLGGEVRCLVAGEPKGWAEALVSCLVPSRGEPPDAVALSRYDVASCAGALERSYTATLEALRRS